MEACGRLLVKQRQVLVVEAEIEEKAARDADKRLTTHNGKVRALLDQLKDIDGAEYIPDPRDHFAEDGSSWTWHSRAATLGQEVRKHVIRAGAIRHFIATGDVPRDGQRFDTSIKWGWNELSPSFIGTDYIPESLYTARDAGLNFSEVGA